LLLAMLLVAAAAQARLDKLPRHRELAARAALELLRQSLARLSLMRVAAVAALTQAELRALVDLAAAARDRLLLAVALYQLPHPALQTRVAAVVEVAVLAAGRALAARVALA